MSRQEVAEAVNEYLGTRHGLRSGLDETYIGKLERGEHRWPNVKYREAFREVLGVATDSALGFYIIRGQATTPPRARDIENTHSPASTGAQEPSGVDAALWVAPDAAAFIGTFTRRDLVERRDAARMMAQIAIGSALLTPLQRWLEGRHEPRIRSGGRCPGFGVQEVEQIESTAQAFRSWDDRFGGGLRRKAVVGQLCEVADMLEGVASTPLTRRLYAAMAQLAGTAATASWDCGRQRLAQHYYLLGLRAAQEADDRAFGANLLAGLGRQLLYLGHNRDALNLIHLAQRWSAGSGGGKVAAMLATRQAWAYAHLGQVAQFRRATAHAEDLLAATGPDDLHPYWIDYFDQAELAGVTGGRLLQLAHHQPKLASESADHISRAISLRRGQRLRSSALDRLGVAEARLLAGDLDEACHLGHDAVTIVEQTPSDRVRVKLREFACCVDRAPRTAKVAELRLRLQGILKTPSHA
jgi:transcriptional regulator with XRE-family HTH domain